MNISLKSLDFILPNKPFGTYLSELDLLTKSLKNIEKKAGLENTKFKKAFTEVYSAINNDRDLVEVLNEPIKIRALAVSLQTPLGKDIRLTVEVFRKINELRPNPSSLLIQNMYQHYLMWYDQLFNPTDVADWLKYAMSEKGVLKDYHKELLSQNGPKWVAEQCITNTREFSNQLTYLELENYAAGRFLTVAKSIYYVEQLKTIPVNQPHPLLLELQNRSAFESRYDEHFLLGHKVLQILIKRAPQTDINDSWLNVIMNIAGDPRVPKTHPKYQKWWSAIDQSLNLKVRGWLSGLDLRLFLEALQDYSVQSGNDELKRMFSSRKFFLEGLLKKKLITHTRLYLSPGAASYLRQNYKAEHLPNYSMVMDGGKSIIYVQMSNAHLIEGSHSCYLWIYRDLDTSAIVFDYERTRVTYSSLTQGLSQKMRLKGTPPQDNITHNPANFSWQRRAIDTLRNIGVNITSKDVLSDEDYSRYIRYHGVG